MNANIVMIAQKILSVLVADVDINIPMFPRCDDKKNSTPNSKLGFKVKSLCETRKKIYYDGH